MLSRAGGQQGCCINRSKNLTSDLTTVHQRGYGSNNERAGEMLEKAEEGVGKVAEVG